MGNHAAACDLDAVGVEFRGHFNNLLSDRLYISPFRAFKHAAAVINKQYNIVKGQLNRKGKSMHEDDEILKN